ncbi:Uncharacterised protein [Achromobacter sp. 2789STDY5608621]|nr:Uncharacterised protein [Achromobacter sp. 2789STDY5608621]
MRQRAQVFVPFAGAVGRRHAVVPHIAGQAQADVAAIHQDVLHADRTHLDRAADGAGRHGRSFVDRHTAEEVRVNVAALLGARVSPVHVQRLLGAIDPHRHPALPLDAADVDVQRPAIAAVADLHARYAGQQVADRHAAEPVEVLTRQVRRGTRRGVHRFLGQGVGVDLDRRQHDRSGRFPRHRHQHVTRHTPAGRQPRVAQQLRKAFIHLVATMQPRALLPGNLPGDQRQRHARLRRVAAQHLRQRPGADVVLHPRRLRLRRWPGRAAQDGERQPAGQGQSGGGAGSRKRGTAARARPVRSVHGLPPRRERQGGSMQQAGPWSSSSRDMTRRAAKRERRMGKMAGQPP